MQVYLTTKETEALIDIANEWCNMMEDGDEDSCKRVDETLDNGLGSALYKLYKGRNGQKHYEEYVMKRNRR